jgi:hypothetical protein
VYILVIMIFVNRICASYKQNVQAHALHEPNYQINSPGVSVTELLIAAKAQEKMNQENRLIKQMLYGAIVVIFVLTGKKSICKI